MQYIAALVLVAFLVAIHEFGHFIVAKLCGVDVKVFSIGMGGRLFGFQWGGTDYRVSWLPFGGYVRMAGADPFMEGGAEEGEEITPGKGFMDQPPWKRLLILFAGPGMNLLLPFVVFTIVYFLGMPQAISEIGTILSGSPAAQAGLKVGDTLRAVNGVPVQTWDDVYDQLLLHDDTAPLAITVESGGQPRALSITASDTGYGLLASRPTALVAIDDPTSPAGKAGLQTGDLITEIEGQPVRDWSALAAAVRADTGDLTLTFTRDGEAHPLTLTPDTTWAPTRHAADDDLWARWGLASASLAVGLFTTDPPSVAKEAGLALGDRILSVDSKPIGSWFEILPIVTASVNSGGSGSQGTARPLVIEVRRAGQIQSFTIQPKVVEVVDEMARYKQAPRLGIGPAGEFTTPVEIPHPYPLGESFRRGSSEVWFVASHIVEQVGKLLVGEASPRDSLGGPVEIFRQSAKAAERGLMEWARLMGTLSISLGVVNLLPVPVLDGGQIVLYFAEWVRGRPLPLVLRERAQQLGVIFLVLLMLFVLVNDIHKAIQ